MAAVSLLAGCNKPLMDGGSVGKGQISFDLSASEDYITTTKAGDNENVNDFNIDIVNQKNGQTVLHYDRFGDMPKIVELPSGEYFLKAMSPNALPAAFDQPVYGKKHSFMVKIGEVASEKIVCTLQNMKVTFNLTERFKSELSSYTISVMNGSGAKNILYWTNASATSENSTTDISKAGYFSVAPLTIRVDATRALDGSEAYHEIKITDGKARDHFKVTLDAKVTGNAGFSIEIDEESVNERDEDVYVPGFGETPVPGEGDDNTGPGDDDTGSGDDSTGSGDDNTGSGDDNTGSGDDNTGSGDTGSEMSLVWLGNEDFSTAEIVPGMAVDLQLTVPGGIKEFLITVTSETPMFMFLVSNMTSTPADYATMDQLESVQIDLINDPVAVAAMAADGIELPTGANLTGKTYVDFPLSNLVPMIPEMGGAGPDTDHTFNLKVTDNNGNVQDWDLTFHVPAN